MKRTVIIITLFFLGFNFNYGQGKLEKAEKSLTKKERSSSRSESRSSGNSYDSGDSFWLEVFGPLFLDVFLITTYGTFIETPIEQEHSASTASITKYPYYNSKKGNYSYEWGDDTQMARATITNRFIAENGKLYGNHLNLDIRFLKRISVEADYLQLWEENTNFGDNSLAIYSFLAKYHRVRTERFDAWWGIGATYIGGEVEQLGFTYGAGAELFFAKPLSVEVNFNQTFIESETVNKFNALLNYHAGRFKFSGGYEHLKIGAPDFSMFSAGVGVSF
ncbi:hypothetical protein [Aquimarina sp. 2201CG5-10]|uniref:hypothetical protein n=1 Tax=Aquimarina callyspongiae TaxID=3098150 RepID=UPI002AB37056|nr:hypothetical protein [Aquimarina sp. 2201CG5-10]MDY8134956.1 hypothetical protein [Aquimarina sp. 2201CG5-10]